VGELVGDDPVFLRVLEDRIQEVLADERKRTDFLGFRAGHENLRVRRVRKGHAGSVFEEGQHPPGVAELPAKRGRSILDAEVVELRPSSGASGLHEAPGGKSEQIARVGPSGDRLRWDDLWLSVEQDFTDDETVEPERDLATSGAETFDDDASLPVDGPRQGIRADDHVVGNHVAPRT